jgi:hypothetical protein
MPPDGASEPNSLQNCIRKDDGGGGTHGRLKYFLTFSKSML